MIEEQGRVVAVDGGGVWVETLRQGSCQSCRARHGCGQRLLNESAAGQISRIWVPAAPGVEVGDQVTLGVAESSLLVASILVYLFPLLALIAGTLFGTWLWPGQEVAAVLSGLGAMLGVFALLRHHRSQLDRQSFRPQLLATCPAGSVSQPERLLIRQPAFSSTGGAKKNG